MRAVDQRILAAKEPVIFWKLEGWGSTDADSVNEAFPSWIQYSGRVKEIIASKHVDLRAYITVMLNFETSRYKKRLTGEAERQAGIQSRSMQGILIRWPKISNRILSSFRVEKPWTRILYAGIGVVDNNPPRHRHLFSVRHPLKGRMREDQRRYGSCKERREITDG